MALPKRLGTELGRLSGKSVEADGFAVTPKGDKPEMVVDLAGPRDSPWEGGVFKLSLTCPPEYPMKPPRVKFISKIWHPNVGGNGDICLDLLQNMWSPALTLEKLILAIASLLTDPNPDSPMNGEAASLFKKSRDQYDAKIRALCAKSKGKGDVVAYKGAVKDGEDEPAGAGKAAEPSAKEAKAGPAKAKAKAKASPKAAGKKRSREDAETSDIEVVSVSESSPAAKRTNRQADWSCSFCTFLNKASSKTCAMCGN
jgi:ubiquitin-protein ligase